MPVGEKPVIHLPDLTGKLTMDLRNGPLFLPCREFIGLAANLRTHDHPVIRPGRIGSSGLGKRKQGNTGKE